MKKILLICFGLFCLALPGTVLAQNITVTGKVTDSSSGEAIPYVTVFVEGTSQGTSTDASGNYTLSVPADATISYSFVGYHNAREKVGNRTRIDVVLAADNLQIEDVIVVAFGTSTREAFTGSAGIVDAASLAQSQQANIAQSLAGRVAGVQISNSSGQLNASPNIRVRGISSINAGKGPLWVVDGAPYDGGVINLNPNDIESMTVLKDATSNSLYGARGANGVIMVTTKKGRTRKATISVDAKVGVNSRARQMYDHISDPAAYYEWHYQSLYNSYITAGEDAGNAHKKANANVAGSSGDGGLGYQVYTVPKDQDFIMPGGTINPGATLGNRVTYNGQEYLVKPDDWMKEIYRKSVRQEYNVTASGMSEQASFYASFGYLNNEGIVQNNDYERYTARLKADYNANKWLKIGGNVTYTNYLDRYIDSEGESSSTANVFAIANRIAPIYPVFIRDGSGNIMTNEAGIPIYDFGDGDYLGEKGKEGMVRPLLGTSNAIGISRLDTREREGNVFNGTGFFDVTFLKDFKFSFSATTMLREIRSTSIRNPYFGQYKGDKGVVTKSHYRTHTLNLQQLLSYNKTFGEHHIDALLGHEYYNWKYSYLTAAKANMFSPNNPELGGAINDRQSANSYTRRYNNEGFFARVQYNYGSKYYLSGSFRRDGSSRFHPDHCWGNFWSVGGAWVMTKENFMLPTATWLDMLKVKASIGSQGNDDLGDMNYDYNYTDTYDLNPVLGELGLVFRSAGNKNITWETNTNFNAGFEFSLFKGLLSGGFDYFSRKTTDMLFQFKTPPSIGYTEYWANIGDMVNRGFEFELNVSPVRSRDVQWDINLNLTHVKNEITHLAAEHKTLVENGHKGYSSGSYFYGEGLSLYTRYMRKYAGINEEGLSTWYMDVKDENNNVVDRTTTTNYANGTYYLSGNPFPDLYGGFGTSVNFYGFDFSINFNYQIGGQVYDSGYASMMTVPTGSTTGYAYHRDLYNSWSATNTGSNIPRWNYGDLSTGSTSDRYLTDASFLNLQNINLGYTLPANLTTKIGLDRVRVYLSWENVYFWSKRKGMDPRYSFTGSTNQTTYSPIRTLSGGLTLTF